MKRLILAIIVVLVSAGAIFFKPDIPVEQLKEKYAQAPSAFMPIEGMQVHYRDQGKGAPLLLLHGTSSSLHTWDGWTQALQDSFRVIRLDLPGFGLTGPHPKKDYSIDMYIRVLDHLLDALQVDTCFIAGNSLGGYIAWNYAAKHPDKIKKVILLNAVAYHEELKGVKTQVEIKPKSFAFRLAGNPITSWLVRWLTPKSLVRKSVKEVYGNDSLVTDEIVTLYDDMLRRKGNRQAFIDNINSRQPEGGEKLLPGLQAPVLIQWGSDDIWVDVSFGRWFSEVLPNDTMIVYQGAGHIPMEEMPAATARDAAAFLKQ